MRDSVIAGKAVMVSTELEKRSSKSTPALKLPTIRSSSRHREADVEDSERRQNLRSSLKIRSAWLLSIRRWLTSWQKSKRRRTGCSEPPLEPEHRADRATEPDLDARARAPPEWNRQAPATVAEDARLSRRNLRLPQMPAHESDAQEFARIDADLLEDLLNAAGEISIYHSRLSQQVNTFEFHVEELEQTIESFARTAAQTRNRNRSTNHARPSGHDWSHATLIHLSSIVIRISNSCRGRSPSRPATSAASRICCSR